MRLPARKRLEFIIPKLFSEIVKMFKCIPNCILITITY